MNFLVKKIVNTPTSLIFELNFDVLLSESSEIIITIYKNHRFQRSSLNEREALQKIDKLKLKFPFPKNVKFDELEPETLYKFNFILKVNDENYEQNLHASTLHKENETVDDIVNKKRYEVNSLPQIKGMSLSEIALKIFAENKAGTPDEISKRKEIKSNILNARKTKDINCFINSDYKFCKPKELSQLRKKRIVMIAESMELFDDIYEITKKNKDLGLLKNEWFMGPFYMYDHNFKKFS